jgi:hypothetical protein
MNVMAETYILQRQQEQGIGRAARARLGIAAEKGRQSAALAACQPLASTNWFVRHRRATGQLFTGYLIRLKTASRMTQPAEALVDPSSASPSTTS